MLPSQPSAWRRVTLDIPTRKYQTPRIYELTALAVNRRVAASTQNQALAAILFL
jgi:hypothetical protein